MDQLTQIHFLLKKIIPHTSEPVRFQASDIKKTENTGGAPASSAAKKPDQLIDKKGKKLSKLIDKFSTAPIDYFHTGDAFKTLTKKIDVLLNGLTKDQKKHIINRQGPKSGRTSLHYLIKKAETELKTFKKEDLKNYFKALRHGRGNNVSISNLKLLLWHKGISSLFEKLVALGGDLEIKDKDNNSVSRSMRKNIDLDFLLIAHKIPQNKNITDVFRFPLLTESLMSNVTVTGGQTFENSIINNVWVFGPGSEPERNQSPQMEELIAACPTASFLALDENTEVLDHVKNIINSKRFENGNEIFPRLSDNHRENERYRTRLKTNFQSSEKNVAVHKTVLQWEPKYFNVLNQLFVKPDVIVATKVLSYVMQTSKKHHTIEYNQSVLKSILQCLQPNGRLILDYTAIRMMLCLGHDEPLKPEDIHRFIHGSTRRNKYVKIATITNLNSRGGLEDKMTFPIFQTGKGYCYRDSRPFIEIGI